MRAANTLFTALVILSSGIAAAQSDRTAQWVERWKQAGNQRRSVVAQVELANPPHVEPRFVQKPHDRLSRIVDDVPRNIESVPFRSEPAELPAVDVGNLEHNRPFRSQDPAHVRQHFAGIRDVLHHVEQGDDIEGTRCECTLRKRPNHYPNPILSGRNIRRFLRHIETEDIESPLL